MHVTSEPAPSAILDQFRRAGYSSLTPLQQRLVPLIFRGRDLAAEAIPGSGKIAAAVYTLIIGYRGLGATSDVARGGPRALVVAADQEELRQVSREWTRFARALGRAPSFAAVGEADDARREQRRLASGAVVVAGTVGRIIDHLRRDSLSPAALETVVVSLPEGEARDGFVRDVQFVLGRCPDRRQTVLLGRPPLAEEGLLALARRPQLIDQVTLAAGTPVRAAIRVPAGMDRLEALLALLVSHSPFPAVVLHAGRASADTVARRLGELGVRAASLPAGAGAPARRRLAAALGTAEIDVAIVPAPLPAEFDLAQAGTVVWLDAPSARDVPVTLSAGTALFALVADEHDLARLPQTIGVTMHSEELPGDAEVIRGAIDRLMHRMAAEDPAEIARLAAQLRRRVPLLKRTALAAFLLKGVLPARQPAAKQPPGRQPPAKQPSRQPPPRERQERPERPERRDERARGSGRGAGSGSDAFTQLFVNAGRNRRVHARELAQLFRERLGAGPDEIGAVRVFDKYSFVEVPSQRAAEAVQRVSGAELGGRPLNVEIAKRREEKPGR